MKSQKRHRLITFILVNTIQYPRTLHNNIYHSKKREPPPFFHSDTNLVFGQVLIHYFEFSGPNSGIDLVVNLEYTFFQLCSNAEQISVTLTRVRRSYVKTPSVVLTSHTSYTGFLLDVRCAVQSGLVFLCSCLSPMMVYLHNLFLLNTLLAQILLIPMSVNRQKDKKM